MEIGFPSENATRRESRELDAAAASHGGILVRCAQTARALLAQPREVGVLHGDLHHGNVLDFGVRGWLAIDPKRRACSGEVGTGSPTRTCANARTTAVSAGGLT